MADIQAAIKFLPEDSTKNFEFKWRPADEPLCPKGGFFCVDMLSIPGSAESKEAKQKEKTVYIKNHEPYDPDACHPVELLFHSGKMTRLIHWFARTQAYHTCEVLIVQKHCPK
jgi:hypothetical protein